MRIWPRWRSIRLPHESLDNKKSATAVAAACVNNAGASDRNLGVSLARVAVETSRGMLRLGEAAAQTLPGRCQSVLTRGQAVQANVLKLRERPIDQNVSTLRNIRCNQPIVVASASMPTPACSIRALATLFDDT